MLRADFSGNPTARELLAQARTAVLDGSANQDVPFDRVVEELRPARSKSHSPLYQVMCVLESAPPAPEDSPELKWTYEQGHGDTAKFDLTLYMTDMGDSVGAFTEYNTDLFDRATVERMMDHYLTLLEGMAAEPERPIAELPLLTPGEKDQALTEWNATKTDYPSDSTTHALFAQWAAKTPEAAAVTCGDTRLTYAEVDARSNKLARALRRRGAEPGSLVGVCLERTEQLAVAMLGILKAGAAYVPLDTAYPPERLAFMLEDTRAPVVVTQTSLQDRLPQGKFSALLLDADSEEIEQEDTGALEEMADAESLAYIIYTSGSTGTPKGVMVPHRAINRLVRQTNYVDIQPGDRIMQASNASFDAATFEFWAALACGGELVVVPRDVTLNPASYAEFLREERITSLFITTALFNVMAREAPGAFRSLREVMFGGEAVDPGSVRRVLADGPPARLMHVYGPTESTTYATWHLVETVDEEATTVPIGGPLANTTLYILDVNGQPVPVGVPGELHIGGDGLAQGYLNRPELTAEAFVPNPFADDPEARMYRTGDLARYLPDGAVEFLGRLDDQVKIRGFRIEPGEVEAVLSRHEAVGEAAVLAREDRPGERRLVAYVSPAEGASPTIDDLRSYMREILPDYMIPSAFVTLEALPLTPNGKVDRKALPAPETDDLTEKEYVAPESETQQTIAAIWQDLLHVDRAGLHDNFFDLGGHSLLATQAVSRFREAFNFDLPLSAVFEHVTIGSLAEHIDTLKWLAGSQDSAAENDAELEGGEI